MEVSLTTARAHWARAQRLVDAPRDEVTGCLEATGWLRTLGGVEAYLAARARTPGLRRADVDAASAALELQVVPAVRGCMYLVPRAHVPLALAVARELWHPRTGKDLEKAGSSWSEVEEIADAVLGVVDEGLTTAQVRKALPEGSVRSLGPAGKKVGMTSALPVALRHLEFRGALVRTLEGGRIDSEKYVWRKPDRDPFADVELPGDLAGLAALLAELFFRGLGPVTRKQFAGWSGLTQTVARQAMATLPLVPVEIEGLDGEYLVHEEVRADLEGAELAEDEVSFLGVMDSHVTLRDGPRPLVDDAHLDLEVEVWAKKKSEPLRSARHVAHRVVSSGGALVGFWEIDLERGGLVVAPFGRLSKARRNRIADAGVEVARFLRDELRSARSYSLDTDAKGTARADRLRAEREGSFEILA